MNRTPRNYILCATPRTGSTYLCSLLKSSGVAGIPESYWRSQDLNRWAKGWGIDLPTDHADFYPAFLTAMLTAWRNDNGVGGLRVMWGTMDEITAALRPILPEHSHTDRTLIDHAFGQPNFVYLERRDVVAQAVSRLKAEQADIWHVEGSNNAPAPTDAYHYDHDQLQAFVDEAQEHNAAWQHWFATEGITPHHIIYEDLCADPTATIHGLLDALGIATETAQTLGTRNQKMADGLSAEWIERFKSASA